MAVGSRQESGREASRSHGGRHLRHGGQLLLHSDSELLSCLLFQMKNRWSDEDANQFVAQYAAQWGEDLALRTYTSRLLGAEENLVLHGGGNTSVKGVCHERLGRAGPGPLCESLGLQSGQHRA